ARGEMRAQEGPVLELNPVWGGELQVGEAFIRCPGQLEGAREAAAVERRQPLEPGAAPGFDLDRRAVGAEDPVVVVGVARDERGDAPREARVARESGMLF